MKIHNRGTFHLYSICGGQVISFQMFSWWCSIHEIVLFGSFLGPNSPKCCQILPKFLPELVFKETQTTLKEFWKNPNFYKKRRYPKFACLVQLWSPFSSWKWPKSRKINKFRKKFSHQTIQICKRQYRISSPLQMKDRITFWTFWAWAKVRGSKSKCNLACAGPTIPEVSNMQRVWSHHLPILSLLTPKVVFFLNFNPHFQVWLLFWVPRPNFW